MCQGKELPSTIVGRTGALFDDQGDLLVSLGV